MTRSLHRCEPPSDRVADLVDAYVAGDASPKQLAELNDAIESDDRAAAYAAAALDLHATLAWSRRGPQRTPWSDITEDAGPPDPLPIYRKGCEPKSASSNFKFSIFNFQFQLLAAALLAACGVAIYIFVSSLPHSEIPDPTSNAPLATLIESSGGTLTTPGGFISDGRAYPAGDYAIDNGFAEFMLTNSVNVNLRGDTHMRMRDAMNVSVTRGRADFVVPSGAVGFTVHLPGNVRVVDLGTRFSVRVNGDGSTVTRVGDGRVSWSRGDVVRPLEAGHALHIADKTITHTVTLGPHRQKKTVGPLRDGGFDFDDLPDTGPETFIAPEDKSDAWAAAGDKLRVRLYRSGEYLKAHSPPAYAQFTGHEFGGSGIVQAVETEPGVTYELAFQLARVGTTNDPTLDIDVYDGTPPKPAEGDLYHQRLLMDSPHLRWREHRVRFTARSAVTTIRFYEPVESKTLSTAPVIDSITLTPLPDAPASPSPTPPSPIGDPQ